MCFVRFRMCVRVGGCIVPLRLTNDGFRFLSFTYYRQRRGDGTICYANGYCVCWNGIDQSFCLLSGMRNETGENRTTSLELFQDFELFQLGGFH